MIQSRKIGDITVTRVHEYGGPTHDPAFLFPELAPADLDRHRALLAPHHYVPHMNRLIVEIQLWVVLAGDNIILVDAGVGNFKPRPDIARMNMLNGLVREWLVAAGAAPEKVTHVLLTHLHADHVGWNTVWTDGRWVPTFPNAKYYIPKAEFDFCFEKRNQAAGVVDVFGASFYDSVMPIVDAGLAVMVEPPQEIADCLTILPAPGHSPGHMIFEVRSGNETGIFTGDVFHSPIQIALPAINSGYCIWGDVARQTRKDVLARAADSEALVMPMHFGEPHCGYIRRQGDGYSFEAAFWPRCDVDPST